MRSRSILAGCLVLLGAAAASAQDTSGVPDGADWRAEVNQRVVQSQHWSWVLRYVERKGETLTIGLAFRNNAVSNRPVFLDADFETTIVLVDDDTSESWPLLSVKGISEEVTRVDRKASREASFTFRYPQGAKSVRFNSIWITMIMMGAAAVIPVEFRLALPPPGARVT